MGFSHRLHPRRQRARARDGLRLRSRSTRPPRTSRRGSGKHKGFEYGRTQNPTRSRLEENMTVLEGGAGARAFASGMAAITAISTFVKQGDHVVCSNMTYGGTYRYYTKILANYGVDVRLRRHRGSERRSSGRSGRRRACSISSRRRIRRCGSPTSRLLSELAHRRRRDRRRRQHLLLAVPPASRSPSGRTSSCTRRRSSWAATPTRSAESPSRRRRSTSSGWASSRTARERSSRRWIPFSCCAASRRSSSGWSGTRRTAAKVAEHLAKHPKVRQVNYPGLPDHPQHALAKKQMKGFGAMISFDLGIARERRRLPREAPRSARSARASAASRR